MKHEEREVRQIYNDYGDDLYRLCYFYTGNVHDAMDAVQNTLVHLMEYTGTFESESHKKSWLLKVGVNECRQLHRQWWRRKVTADESLIDMEKVGVQTSDVWESVMSLPTKYRIAIYLYYYVGYSTEEIAKIMEKQSSTVRSLLLRARKKLKEELVEPQTDSSSRI